MAVEIKESISPEGSVKIEIQDIEKSTATYTVSKTEDGTSFFEIKINKGKLPKELSSVYTKTQEAENVVKRYLANLTPTKVARRDSMSKRIQESKQ